MGTRSIGTDAGILELITATIDQLRGIARYWPMELIASADIPDHFGLVFQHGHQEIHGVKIQPTDITEADAWTLHEVKQRESPPDDDGHRNGCEAQPRSWRLGDGLRGRGSSVFVVSDPLHEDDAVWEYVVRAGFSRLPYATMKPVALPAAPPAGSSRA